MNAMPIRGATFLVGVVVLCVVSELAAFAARLQEIQMLVNGERGLGILDGARSIAVSPVRG
jgi:hypothetical protein